MAKRLSTKRSAIWSGIFEYIDADASAVRLTNSDRDGRYKIIKEVIADPHHSVVLMRVRVKATSGCSRG